MRSMHLKVSSLGRHYQVMRVWGLVVGIWG